MNGGSSASQCGVHRSPLRHAGSALAAGGVLPPSPSSRVSRSQASPSSPSMRRVDSSLQNSTPPRNPHELPSATGRMDEKEARLMMQRLEQAEAEALAALQAVGTCASGQARNGVRLIVFDFDRTISKEHMWGTHRDAPLHTIPIIDETFVDLRAFRAFVSSARRHGHVVAIATFGRRDVAAKAMSFALGEDHGVTITTPADFPDPTCLPDFVGPADVAPRCPEGSSLLGNKNRQLVALAWLFGVSAIDMVLIDDDDNNVKEAARAGVAVKHTPSGATKAVLSSIAKNIGIPS